MKKIIIVAMLLIGAYSYSQKNECKTKSSYDEFTETTQIQGLSFNTSKEKYPVQIQFLKYKYKDKQSYNIVVIGNSNGCISRKSKVIFILGNNEKIEFLRGQTSIKCGVSHMIVDLKEEDVEKLLNNIIIKGRLDYGDNIEDFNFSEKGQKEFISNLKCIIDAK